MSPGPFMRVASAAGRRFWRVQMPVEVSDTTRYRHKSDDPDDPGKLRAQWISAWLLSPGATRAGAERYFDALVLGGSLIEVHDT
jgi:hypothetical protein